MYSEFLNEFYLYDIKSETGSWVKESVYYKGDFSKADFTNDWRFKSIPNMRKELKFLGLKDMIFPEIQINWLIESKE